MQNSSFFTSSFSSLNHHTFGMVMPGRSFTSESYRFGFQGQEEDNETGLVNYKYRMHDPRLGSFFAVDPLAASFPWNSPYAFSENDLIRAVELEGLEKRIIINRYSSDASGNTVLRSTTVITTYQEINSSVMVDMNVRDLTWQTTWQGENYLIVFDQGNMFEDNMTRTDETMPNAREQRIGNSQVTNTYIVAGGDEFIPMGFLRTSVDVFKIGMVISTRSEAYTTGFTSNITNVAALQTQIGSVNTPSFNGVRDGSLNLVSIDVNFGGPAVVPNVIAAIQGVYGAGVTINTNVNAAITTPGMTFEVNLNVQDAQNPAP